MKKKILLIGTGGTIACKQTDHGLAPSFTSEELISYIPEAQKFCEVDAVQICNLDSTNITPEHWSMISRTIEEKYSFYDGFVVCHGTDTLAYTTAALSYMIQNSAKPVVVTGAQKPINDTNTDARTNLYDSLLYASDDDSNGVVLVFDGKVIAGTRAKKERAKSYNAFSSINFPYLAIIQDGHLIRYIPTERPRWRVRFYHDMGSRVYVLKFTPGLDAEILTWIFENADGLIFESFGVGGIPHYLLEKLEELMEVHPNKMVVVATQVVHEGSDMMVYQVGKKVKQELQLLETYDMTLEAAVSKAMWILASEHIEIEDRKEAFYKPVNYDLTLHFKEDM